MLTLFYRTILMPVTEDPKKISPPNLFFETLSLKGTTALAIPDDPLRLQVKLIPLYSNP